jgi:PHD/YefM family antitoxin component YafN of YafNO toxin-antitoxin module
MESHYLWLLQVNMVGSYKMDKQIEELANDLQEAWTAWSLSADLSNPYAFVAEILAKKWQPKIPECAVVLTREEQERHIIMTKTNYESIMREIKQARKEAVEKFAERLKEIHDYDERLCDIADEICEELVANDRNY